MAMSASVIPLTLEIAVTSVSSFSKRELQTLGTLLPNARMTIQ